MTLSLTQHLSLLYETSPIKNHVFLSYVFYATEKDQTATIHELLTAGKAIITSDHL